MTLSRVDSSTWRLGRQMCKNSRNYEPWPPKIETANCDVLYRLYSIQTYFYVGKSRKKCVPCMGEATLDYSPSY